MQHDPQRHDPAAQHDRRGDEEAQDEHGRRREGHGVRGGRRLRGGVLPIRVHGEMYPSDFGFGVCLRR